MVRHVRVILLSAVCGVWAQGAPQKMPLLEDLHDPIDFAVAENGDLFVVEREGRVLRVRPQTGGVFPVGQLEVSALRQSDPDSPYAREDGILGIALDPAFAENRRLYLFYSAPDEKVDRVSRFVLQDGRIDPASERVLLDIPVERDNRVCHHGGSLLFGPDGLFYITVGDNTSPFESDGFAPIDDRPDRKYWDAQRSAGNTNDLRGKILRLRLTEDGYEIPEGNLFAPGMPNTRPEIYIMGCRNPYRASIDPKTNFLYWGEVGPDAGAENPLRGPAGHDEINQARKAGNYGWPFVIADNRPYWLYDFAEQKSLEKIDPAAPKNPGARNNGLKVLPPAQPAMIWYPYAESPEFPALGKGGRCAMAGPVFYYEESRRWNLLGREEDHTFLPYDWTRGVIWKAKLDAEENLGAVSVLVDGLVHPISAKLAPDGTLWVLEQGPSWWFNTAGRLLAIRPDGAGAAPELEIAPVEGAERQYEVRDLAGGGEEPVSFRWYLTQGVEELDLGGATIVTLPPGGRELRGVATSARGAVTVKRIALEAAAGEPELALSLPEAPASLASGDTLAFEVRADPAPDPSLVTVRARYVPAAGHDSGSPEFPEAVRKLVTERQCLACHQIDQASVGPKYLDVALRFRGREDAVPYLTAKLRDGGGGNWGVVPMPPQVALAAGEGETLVQAILALADGMAQTKGQPAGSLPIPASSSSRTAGGHWEVTAAAPGYQTARIRIPAN